MHLSPASRSFVKTVKRTSPKVYIQFIAVAERDIDYRLCEQYYKEKKPYFSGQHLYQMLILNGKRERSQAGRRALTFFLSLFPSIPILKLTGNYYKVCLFFRFSFHKIPSMEQNISGWTYNKSTAPVSRTYHLLSLRKKKIC